MGFRVLRQVIENVTEIHIRRIAEGDDGRKANVMFHRPVENGGTQCTRLRHQCQVAAFGLVLTEGGIHAATGPNQTQAVGAENTHLVLAGGIHRSAFIGQALAVAFTETGGNDDRGTDAVFTTGMNYLGHSGSRGGNDRQVYRMRNRSDIGITGVVIQGIVFRVNGKDGTGKTAFQQIFIDSSTDSICTFTGTKDCDSLWGEQTVKIMGSHIN